jgi:hypothetical protein
MSARRRHQLRDHLGRFMPARRRAGTRLRRAARASLALALAALRSDLSRRLGRLALLGAALAAAVVVLYQHGEAPAALAHPAGARPAAATTTSSVRAAPAATAAPATKAAPATSVAPAAARPGEVAAAWYAARHHLPAGKVQALQQDVISKRAVRVLVLADAGGGRLDTALVTVRRDAAGRWSAP